MGEFNYYIQRATNLRAFDLADFIADGILIILPLCLLWRVNLPRHIRSPLYSIFSASILVTVASIVHACFLLGPSGLKEALAAEVEVHSYLRANSLGALMTPLSLPHL